MTKLLYCDCGNNKFEIISHPCPGCGLDHVFAVCCNPECKKTICITEDTSIFDETTNKPNN